MEGLGVAASVIAVVDMSAKVASLCTDYFKAVKNARSDIERLQSELASLNAVMHGAEKLVNGPDANRLQTTQQLETGLEKASSQLRQVADRLDDKHNHGTWRTMSCYGFRALKWPFEKSEVGSIIQNLRRNRDTISAALMIDNTTLHVETHSNVQNIKSGVQQVSSSVQDISSGVEYISRTLDMAKLPVAKGAAFDSQTNEHDPMCLPNTRVELRQAITEWAEDPCSDTIFWLNGMAGTGKSTISRTIAHSFSQKKMLGASFFFKRGERDRGNASRLFTTLAAQLINRLPGIGPLAIKAIEDEPDLPNKFIQEQFEKLILDPLHVLDKKRSPPRVLVLVIDALDECDKLADSRLIINILTSLRSLVSIKLKAFVTSRPELPIRLGFKSIKGKYKDLILHEIPKPIIEHDISEFFHHQLEQARVEHNCQSDSNGQLGPEWPGLHATNALIQMAIPLFIFAATVCRFIQDPLYDPLTQLKKVLTYKSSAQDSEMQKLDTTYRPTLDQLIVGRTGRAKENLLRDFRDLVGVIILLAEPLSISQLSRFVDTPNHTIEGILRHLHSVLSVPSSPQEPVRMLHLSFHDFLVDKELRETNPFWVDRQEMHNKIATKCLDLLCSESHLKQNICGLGWPGTRRADIKQEDVNLKLPDQVRYACLYWTHHMEESGLKITDSHLAFSFLEGKFLFWLEALALLGEAHNCSSMIASIQSVVDPEHGAGLSSFLRDAARFVTRVDYVINEYPLQIYASGLVFAPSESIVGRAFQKCIPEWITQLPQVPQSWDASLRVIETSLESRGVICFSSDSRSLKTVSDIGVPRVWDTMTGKQIDNLEPKGHNIVFTPDGECLLSQWGDSSIFWENSMRTVKHRFKKHSSQTSTLCLALSADGKLAAYASYDSPALVLYYRAGEIRERSFGEDGGTPDIALSPNGKLLAVARNNKMQLWELDSGQKTDEFPVAPGVWKLRFSPNGGLIAFAHSGWVVVYDVTTGRECQNLGGTDWVSAIAFEPGGRRLAAASGRTVRLWDLATGEETQRFEHPCNHVLNMVFSPDGSLLAASSDQGMILLWDPTINNDADSTSGHGGSIKNLALSRDGNQVASVSEGGSVGIWDLNTAQNIKTMARPAKENIIGAFFSQVHSNHLWLVSDSNTIKCHNFVLGGDFWADHFGESRKLRGMVVSPNGNTLALEYPGVVRIWDLLARKVQHELWTNQKIGAFSSDSKMFASATGDSEVTILDLASGHLQAILSEGLLQKLDPVTALSLRDSTLAVASYSQCVTIWDTDSEVCLSRVRTDARVNCIEFNATGSHLITEIGTIKVLPSRLHGDNLKKSAPHRDFKGYGATGDFTWITWKSRPFMWLPPSLRPSVSVSTQRASFFIGSTIILGSVSGSVSIVKFVETPPWASQRRPGTQSPSG